MSHEPQPGSGMSPTPGPASYEPPPLPGSGPGAPPLRAPAPAPPPPGAEPTSWAVGDSGRRGPLAGPYGSQGAFPTQPMAPYGDPRSAYPPPYGSPAPATASANRWGQIVVACLLTAALTAGAVWGVMRVTTTAPKGDTGGRIVVQADPNNPNWAATAAVVSPSVVSITITFGSSGGRGSGVILDTEGHVITNNHVVDSGGAAAKISVGLSDKRAYNAKIVGTDPATDLAVVKLENAPADLRPIAVGDDTKLKVGDPVMAIGNPLGLSGTVTTGIVSALNRPVRTTSDGATGSGEAVVTNAIQTSAAINPGNSGGALVNGSGQLVGINSSIAQTASNSGNIGIGFAIPSNEARSVAEQLIKTGTVKHAFLGVTPAADSAIVPDGNDQRAAAKINAVAPGGPAEKAGIKEGDAVVAVDGEAVDGPLSLVAQIRERSVGDQVTLTIIRNAQRQDVRVTLGERPA